MSIRRHTLLSLAVIMMGTAALAMAPARASADEEESESSFGGCTWCRDSCPSSLWQYCGDEKNCAQTAGPVCQADPCTGATTGEEYSYTVRCAGLN
jgi:hypothetical protein